MKPIEKLHRLSTSHGELRSGKGMVSGVIALSSPCCVSSACWPFTSRST